MFFGVSPEIYQPADEYSAPTLMMGTSEFDSPSPVKASAATLVGAYLAGSAAVCVILPAHREVSPLRCNCVHLFQQVSLLLASNRRCMLFKIVLVRLILLPCSLLDSGGDSFLIQYTDQPGVAALWPVPSLLEQAASFSCHQRLSSCYESLPPSGERMP